MTLGTKVKICDSWEPEKNGAPGTIRTCGLYLRRVALYPAELRVPETRNYSPLITLVNDALTRLKPVRVADHGFR